jgi:hypothetical protein
MRVNGIAWTEAETNFATATWDAAGCRIWVDAVEKGLRTSPNSDSADSMDHLLGGGDDGAAE